MRSGLLLVVALGTLLSGCGSRVDQGWQGATSPAESGEHGSTANQLGTAEPEKKGEDQTAGMKEPEPLYSNGNADRTMEGSGNIAAQGNYAKAAQQRANSTSQLPH